MSHKKQYTPDTHEHPDQWHRHTPDEGQPQEEHAARVNNAALAIVFVSVVAFVAGTILVTTLYFQRYLVQERERKIEVTSLGEGYREYRDAAKAAQQGFGWADAEAGKVVIPVEMATERVVARYGSPNP